MRDLFRAVSQVLAVTILSLGTIPQRKGASLAAAFGIAGVVAVLVGVLSIAQGFRRTMAASGNPETAIILRAGSDTEMMSILPGDISRMIGDCEYVARSPDGALVSPELFVIINLPKRVSGTDANVPLRGVEPISFQVHNEVELMQGRLFTPGRNEIIVGRGAARECAGLDLNSIVQVGSDEWTVVGIFKANGGIAESEIWADAKVIQSVYEREHSYQTIYARMPSADDFQNLKDALTTDPRFNVKVMRQSEFYADQSRSISSFINTLGTLVAALMAIGAIFGALNTMYTAVSARTREIATLRALGFGTGPVLFSILLESVCLALAGGAIGAAAAYFAFDGLSAATLNFQSLSQVAFSFAVTPLLLVQGLIWALFIGFCGGLLPALRAGRMSIAQSFGKI